MTFTKKEIKQMRQIAGVLGQSLPVVVFPGASPPKVFGTAGHWSPGKSDVWRKSDREVRVGREWCAAQGIGTLEENLTNAAGDAFEAAVDTYCDVKNMAAK